MNYLSRLIIASALTIFAACTPKATVSSPDGSIGFEIKVVEGTPYYTVTKDKKTVLSDSKLGFILANQEEFGNMEIVSVEKASADETWETVWGERHFIRDNHNEIAVTLKESAGSGRSFVVRARVFDDGFGFRYEFTGTDSLVIKDELTEFSFANETRAWWMSRCENDYYEAYGNNTPISQIDTALTPLVVVSESGQAYSIHEAALTDYAKMNLVPTAEGRLKAELTPWLSGERKGMKVYAKAPFNTPWRTMVIAPAESKLIESTLMLNLNEPSEIEDVSWIKPGKYVGIWWILHLYKDTWASGPNHGATTAKTKEYIDFAAENGFAGVLVEGWNKGWDGNWMKNSKGFSFTEAYPDYDFDEIMKYAASKGVQMVIHNEYAADTENYLSQIDDAYTLYSKYGMHYVKTGNVNVLMDGIEEHDGQYGVNKFRQIVTTAAAYQINIDEHEPPIPTGVGRTWPNLMTHEAVRGQEHDAWEEDGGNRPEHNTIIPYMRGLAGPADCTFGTFNFDNPNSPFSRVNTTIAKQLAQYVVIYSPLQMASDLPENYRGKKAFDFIRDVPADWEETIGVDGKIGDYAVTARKGRGSNEWFLGCLTDENARDLKVSLDFLDPDVDYLAQVYADGDDASYENNPTSVKYYELVARKGDVLSVHMATSGGTAVRFVPLHQETAPEIVAKAATELAQRVLGKRSDEFVFALDPSLEGDSYEISMNGGKIAITGNNDNSVAVGLNTYLKDFCLTEVTWNLSDEVVLPDMLPAVSETVKASARVSERFFLNYCTFGYTMPWWKWDEWEHFIDWMALNGVNLPLAITGQEAIWLEVWKKYGIPENEILSYFTGPAHLPWHRMNNIDKWEGPLPKSWLKSQLALQKKILARERELNMKPILPAFAGHVPEQLAALHPEANISRLSFWGGFEDEYRCSFLSPTDPLYQQIQKDFLAEQTKQFGTDHIYGVDLFNEVDAPSWEPEVLAGMARDVYKSLSDNDPEARWLQMGWLFYADEAHWTDENIKAYLRAVPQDKVILLDYYCEFTQIWTRTESFYSQPYIWCYLGNFGGNTVMTGNLRESGERFEGTLANGGDNLCGIGSTLEGFGVNLAAYEYILDKAWDNCKEYDDWFEALADRHHGNISPAARKAWKKISDEVYLSFSRTGQSNLVCSRPRSDSRRWWTTKPVLDYNCDQLMDIWKTLLEEPSCSDSYLTDIANIGREYLGKRFYDKWEEAIRAYETHDLQAFSDLGAEMLDIIDDMDELLATRDEFSLKKWIDDARAFGKNSAEKDYYEKNARTLLSVWGGKKDLNDYASRSWAGLLSSYYKVRWQMFIEDMAKCIESGEEFDNDAFEKKSMEFEWQWLEPSYKIDYPEKGCALAVSERLIQKYDK